MAVSHSKFSKGVFQARKPQPKQPKTRGGRDLIGSQPKFLQCYSTCVCFLFCQNWQHKGRGSPKIEQKLSPITSFQSMDHSLGNSRRKDAQLVVNLEANTKFARKTFYRIAHRLIIRKRPLRNLLFSHRCAGITERLHDFSEQILRNFAAAVELIRADELLAKMPNPLVQGLPVNLVAAAQLVLPPVFWLVFDAIHDFDC